MALRLESLKVKALKHIAFLTGCASPTNKTALIDTLQWNLQRPAARQSRIVSVDMGIKNFAYCVLDRLDQGQGERTTKDPIDVKVWTKIDLLDDLKKSGRRCSADDVLMDDKVDLEVAADISSTADIFTPQNVSKMAFTLSQRLLAHNPDVILIEQQRFRSGGGSAIQEWTIRVNMLESMLWACLESHHQLAGLKKCPSVFSMNPAKVARFWVAGNDMLLTPGAGLAEGQIDGESTDKAERKKITKADKIAVLKSWLSMSGKNSVPLRIADDVQAIADLYMPRTRARNGQVVAKDKLDDYTDCVLQGAAWLQWEDNRAAIASMLDARK